MEHTSTRMPYMGHISCTPRVNYCPSVLLNPRVGNDINSHEVSFPKIVAADGLDPESPPLQDPRYTAAHGTTDTVCKSKRYLCAVMKGERQRGYKMTSNEILFNRGRTKQ